MVSRAARVLWSNGGLLQAPGSAVSCACSCSSAAVSTKHEAKHVRSILSTSGERGRRLSLIGPRLAQRPTRSSSEPRLRYGYPASRDRLFGKSLGSWTVQARPSWAVDPWCSRNDRPFVSFSGWLLRCAHYSTMRLHWTAPRLRQDRQSHVSSRLFVFISIYMSKEALSEACSRHGHRHLEGARPVP